MRTAGTDSAYEAIFLKGVTIATVFWMTPEFLKDRVFDVAELAKRHANRLDQRFMHLMLRHGPRGVQGIPL